MTMILITTDAKLLFKFLALHQEEHLSNKLRKVLLRSETAVSHDLQGRVRTQLTPCLSLET